MVRQARSDSRCERVIKHSWFMAGCVLWNNRT